MKTFKDFLIDKYKYISHEVDDAMPNNFKNWLYYELDTDRMISYTEEYVHFQKQEEIKEQVNERIRDILNEEMVNYEEVKSIGQKDEVFDRTCDEIFKLFEQEKTGKRKCKVSYQFGEGNNKDLRFYCEFCGKEMEYDEDRICEAM